MISRKKKTPPGFVWSKHPGFVREYESRVPFFRQTTDLIVFYVKLTNSSAKFSPGWTMQEYYTSPSGWVSINTHPSWKNTFPSGEVFFHLGWVFYTYPPAWGSIPYTYIDIHRTNAIKKFPFFRNSPVNCDVFPRLNLHYWKTDSPALQVPEAILIQTLEKGTQGLAQRRKEEYKLWELSKKCVLFS